MTEHADPALIDRLHDVAQGYAEHILTLGDPVTLSFIFPAQGGHYRVLSVPDWRDETKARTLTAIQCVLIAEQAPAYAITGEVYLSNNPNATRPSADPEAIDGLRFLVCDARGGARFTCHRIDRDAHDARIGQVISESRSPGAAGGQMAELLTAARGATELTPVAAAQLLRTFATDLTIEVATIENPVQRPGTGHGPAPH